MLAAFRSPPIRVWHNLSKLFCWWQSVCGENIQAFRASLWDLVSLLRKVFCAFCFCCGFFVAACYLLSASRLGWPSLRIVLSHFPHPSSFPARFFFGLSCVVCTCAIEPLRVWARFFCLPLLPLSRLRAVENGPKVKCELMLRWILLCCRKNNQTLKKKPWNISPSHHFIWKKILNILYIYMTNLLDSINCVLWSLCSC